MHTMLLEIEPQILSSISIALNGWTSFWTHHNWRGVSFSFQFNSSITHWWYLLLDGIELYWKNNSTNWISSNISDWYESVKYFLKGVIGQTLGNNSVVFCLRVAFAGILSVFPSPLLHAVERLLGLHDSFMLMMIIHWAA